MGPRLCEPSFKADEATLLGDLIIEPCKQEPKAGLQPAKIGSDELGVTVPGCERPPQLVGIRIDA